MNSSEDDDFIQLDVTEFGSHDGEVENYEILITGAADNCVRIFNAVTACFLVKLEGHTEVIQSLAVSNDSKFCASASYDKTVRIWRIRNASLVHVLHGHAKSVECVRFSRNSRYVCSGSWDRTALLWDIEVLADLHLFYSFHIQQGTISKYYLGHDNLVQCIAFSYNGQWMVTGSWDKTARLYDIQNDGVMVLKGHKGNVLAAEFSKEGMLATCSADKTVKLWNPRDGDLLHTLKGHKSWVRAMGFSPDSLLIASVGVEDKVFIWDVVSGKFIRKLKGRTEEVQHCGFQPGGTVVAAGSAGLVVALL